MYHPYRQNRQKQQHTCGLPNGQSKPNGGVAEGHDSCQNRQEPETVKVRNLTQQQLEGSKDSNEGSVGYLHRNICYSCYGSNFAEGKNEWQL